MRGERVVVVGHGVVSWKLCQELVSKSSVLPRERSLVVLGEEPRAAYDRVHLTDVLSGRPPAELELARREWYFEHGIDLRLADPVLSIDRERRVVTSASGVEAPYDRLVLATGARALVPDLPGAELSGVFVYRTLDDLEAIRAQLPRARRAVVVGGGLLGLEVSRALSEAGLSVTVVHAGPWLMGRQLDEEGGGVLASLVEGLGISVRVGVKPSRITPDGASLSVELSSGSPLPTDLVVLATGTRARSELALAAGLSLSSGGGILVDDHLRTSDPNIFAIGDCASHRGTSFGLVLPGLKMAEVLADHLAGGARTFAGVTPVARLKMRGLAVSSVGRTDDLNIPDARAEIHRSPGKYRKLVLVGGKLVGAISIGEWPAFDHVRVAVEEGRLLGRDDLDLYHRTGTPWPDDVLGIELWPPEAIVCQCKRVARGPLGAAVAAGCSSVEALGAKTGAGTMCGGCVPLLAELVDVVTQDLPAPNAPPALLLDRELTPRGLSRTTGSLLLPERGRRALVVGTTLAIAAAGLLLAAAPLDAPGSVDAPLVARLWADRELRAISGWIALASVLLSLGLSLHAKIPWIRTRAIDPGHWRAIHVFVGATTLATLVFHTGLRLGQNLNRALMIAFLGSMFLGLVAALVTIATRHGRDARARALRHGWTRSHGVLVWPLGVLLVLHVLSTYYY
ncbi:FAD-dependent oxidoreductase [Myxococcota bacterium]|nr:FAD-dependent oxidoreductase [Myxococcota bacterium]